VWIYNMAIMDDRQDMIESTRQRSISVKPAQRIHPGAEHFRYPRR
jgi:hypothetical protein